MNNQIVKVNAGELMASTVDVQVLKTMLPVERRYIEAALQPKIHTQPPIDVVDSFINLVTITYTRAGQQCDAVTLATFADEFYSAVMEKYPNVSIAEVREALKAGVYGEAGEYFGLNPKTFMQFLKSYLFSENRKEAQKLFESKQSFIQQQVTLTPLQKEVYNMDFTNTLYESFLEGKLLTDFIPVYIYEFLVEKGKVNFTVEEKKAIHIRAQSYYARLRVSSRFKSNNPKRIGEMLPTAGLQYEDTVKRFAKQFAVADYFDIMKLRNQLTIFPKPKLLSNGN